jgi:hypothetical protein
VDTTHVGGGGGIHAEVLCAMDHLGRAGVLVVPMADNVSSSEKGPVRVFWNVVVFRRLRTCTFAVQCCTDLASY